MNISGVTECELCEQVISEVVTSSTIPGVTEMVGNDIVCSANHTYIRSYM